MKNFLVTETTFLTPDIFLLTLRAERERDCFIHIPGQYAAIGFQVNGRPTPMRCFSIVNAPNNTGIIQFAIKVSGSFTHTATYLQKGNKVKVQGPFGEFVVNKQFDRNVVMLAGGIGITPFMSMLRNAASTQSPIHFTLLYSCQNQAAIPFFDELIKLEQQNQNFSVQFYITNGSVAAASPAHLYEGRIDPLAIAAATPKHPNAYTYFICGPNGFMNSVQEILRSRGVYPDNIVSEAFTQGASGRAVINSQNIPKLIYKLTSAAIVLGIGFIMTLDLMRAVPKIMAAETTQASQVTEVQTTATPASTSISSTLTPTATPYVQNYTYQQPVTSVS